MKKLFFLTSLIVNAFAYNALAQNAEDIFKKNLLNQDGKYEDIGEGQAYAFYDVDGDGVTECFIKGEDNLYGMWTCGDSNGKPNAKSIKLCANNIPTTILVICKGKPFVSTAGWCGGGCQTDEFFKLEKSSTGTVYSHMTITTIEGEEESTYSMWKPGMDAGRSMSKTVFEKSVPSRVNSIGMDELDWKPITKKKQTSAPAASKDGVANVTLHTEVGDTIILKDAKGYLYQLMSSGHVGVAPGGAYSGDIVIPSQIRYKNNIYPVTTVRRGAMWKKAGANNIGTITSVVLPESVTLVGSDAFRDNTSLTNVTYGADTRIEVRSFYGCPSLRLTKYPCKFAFTHPFPYESPASVAKKSFAQFCWPSEKKDSDITEYQWGVFKYQHNAIGFVDWKNMNSSEAMECYTSEDEKFKGGMFKLKDPENVETMFKGYMSNDQIVLLAHNNYVATHEFVMFSRYVWGEKVVNMPAAISQQMAKKYGRKVKYCVEVAKVLYTKPTEQLVLTEFDITNHEAMIVMSWMKEGKEVCSYVLKQKTDPEYEDMGVWNVDDDGTYGIPTVVSITKDEKGSLELFLCHPAPESLNFMHLVQKGNKFVLEAEDGWYCYVG